MSPYIGEIRMWPGTFAPVQWHFCDGSLLSISEYQALFTLIGTTYGGNGVTNFALPDLRGRAPIHFGTGAGLSPKVLGQAGGTETVTLLTSQMPAHTHTITAQSADGNSASPSNTYFAAAGTGDKDYALGSVTPNVTMAPNSVGSAGGNVPYEILQPLLALNFIISLYGIWPSQN